MEMPWLVCRLCPNLFAIIPASFCAEEKYMSLTKFRGLCREHWPDPPALLVALHQITGLVAELVDSQFFNGHDHHLVERS